MMAFFHYVVDAYDLAEDNAGSCLNVNKLLVELAEGLGIKQVMPPFILPYYYCDETEDEGISAFLFCSGGHITIHTFPKRSCYFADILCDSFFEQKQLETILNKYIHAEQIFFTRIDRRFTESTPRNNSADKTDDFGPHYLISVNDVDMTMESIYKWLDNIAEMVNMQPIIRPYVIFDKRGEPRFISGLLLVAQSHISVHYDMQTRSANIDLFSCSFLDDATIMAVLKNEFGDKASYQLFTRGSKYAMRYLNPRERNASQKKWRMNSK